MLNKIVATVLALGLQLTVATVALADTGGTVLGGFQKTGSQAGFALTGNAPQKDFVTAFLGFANALTILLATVFVLLVIYSGYLWMSARGNEQQVEKAKKIILGAAIGIIMVIAARAIAELALEVFSLTLFTGLK